MDDEHVSEQALVEKLLETSCWVVDLLPLRVPQEAGARYFGIEPLLLEGRRARRRFADVLLAIHCYYDFCVFHGDSAAHEANPKPKKLRKWVLQNKERVTILLPEVTALIVVPTDSTCFAIYNPTDQLLDLVRTLANAHGLFVWETT